MNVVEEVILSRLRQGAPNGLWNQVWCAAVMWCWVTGEARIHEANRTGAQNKGQIFVLSLSGATSGLANAALAGMQGLELPRGALPATIKLDRQGSLVQHYK